MSKEIEAIKDPGLPAHVHRAADSDPKAAKKAERQVAILFLLSAAEHFSLSQHFSLLMRTHLSISR